MKLASFALLALLAAPLALAAVAPVACATTCAIPSTAAGYVAPATIVTSGASVSWTSLDAPHVNRDGASGAGSCFGVSYGPASPSDAVTLTIADGALHATVDGDTRACTTATALSDGSFAMPYFCALHPDMRGVLVVRP